MKIRYTKYLPNGKQEFVNYTLSEAVRLGFAFTKDNCKFTICEHDKFTVLKMQLQYATSLNHLLNGDMANEFNDSHPADEDDLGYRFNDDECRGNQW